ncbi:RNA polymerase-binding transcription factor DksA [Kribbella orskensis]|uniref:RNA polymerase-binding transcription factor DksA n=1 Tax=Kribbella orskensis TaxID=2512216 RepID=A0ABY2BAD7_9ACTN|nr:MULTISPECIES: TraR/DksA family transcriptional regulator [Kribbella]TCN32888.1 RNA polymerase-binding transcription factor DksA [Kribbella sp. VKM Ac-2500]TCO13238.1 RNA polymerase-binding transcription factor DksA [Kribbella orskensis]
MSDLDQAAPPSAPRGRRVVDSQRFRVELEQQRRFRLEQLTQLVCDTTAANDDDASGQVTSTLMTAVGTVLAEIDAALFRLAIGSFGICQRCSRTIPSDRLEAIPMACLCLQCQYREESRGSQPDPVAGEPTNTVVPPPTSPPPQDRYPTPAADIVDVWGIDSFPASDPPANW